MAGWYFLSCLAEFGCQMKRWRLMCSCQLRWCQLHQDWLRWLWHWWLVVQRYLSYLLLTEFGSAFHWLAVRRWMAECHLQVEFHLLADFHSSVLMHWSVFHWQVQSCLLLVVFHLMVLWRQRQAVSGWFLAGFHWQSLWRFLWEQSNYQLAELHLKQALSCWLYCWQAAVCLLLFFYYQLQYRSCFRYQFLQVWLRYLKGFHEDWCCHLLFWFRRCYWWATNQDCLFNLRAWMHCLQALSCFQRLEFCWELILFDFLLHWQWHQKAVQHWRAEFHQLALWYQAVLWRQEWSDWQLAECCFLFDYQMVLMYCLAVQHCWLVWSHLLCYSFAEYCLSFQQMELLQILHRFFFKD